MSKNFNSDLIKEIDRVLNTEVKSILFDAVSISSKHLLKFQTMLEESDKEQISSLIQYLSYLESIISAINSKIYYETRTPCHSNIILNNLINEVIFLFRSNSSVEFFINQNKALVISGNEEELKLLLFNLIDLLIQQSSDATQVHINLCNMKLIFKCNGTPLTVNMINRLFSFPVLKKIGNIHDSMANLVYPILKSIMKTQKIKFDIKGIRGKGNNRNEITLNFMDSLAYESFSNI